MQLIDVALDDIVVSEFCEREGRDDDVKGLAEDIEKHGMVNFPTRGFDVRFLL